MKIKYVTYFFVLSFGNILFLFSKTIPNLPYGFPIELRHSTYCSCSDTLPLNDSLQVTKDSVIVKP
ncbi:MAG TPA: hypothetical protein EYP69_04285, partial [Bacteroidales bacterium]|nr:hypothetical protein [Bacteroidales bacterium]